MRVVYVSEQENAFYQVSSPGFDEIVEAAESGYGIHRVLCLAGDGFVVRTREGHYAKLLV
ncbi:MAG: hypothetical protein E4H08_04230 [Candidatus Atribacteria bacterium]|nr:MAG: hypothetical protein E4H08_04230 [Candidatus Atribacteria bacterium]